MDILLYTGMYIGMISVWSWYYVYHLRITNIDGFGCLFLTVVMIPATVKSLISAVCAVTLSNPILFLLVQWAFSSAPVTVRLDFTECSCSMLRLHGSKPRLDLCQATFFSRMMMMIQSEWPPSIGQSLALTGVNAGVRRLLHRWFVWSTLLSCFFLIHSSW